jgi:ABC-type multidrug transport system fused ATPase/permease subunit
MAAVTTLAFPLALRSLIDGGLINPDKGAQTMALREHFGALFAVAVALGLFSAARFYTVSWLGERVTADLRNAVYGHVLNQSPAFFETTQTGEVLSRLTADTTLVQTVVGSSLSMGLRNAVMGVGALAVLVWTNPYVMVQVLGILVLVVLPSMWFGRRVRKLSRASQDRVADSSAIAAEVLNAIPVVQSYTAEGREATASTPRPRTPSAPPCAAPRRARCWWPSSSSRPRPRCSGACTRARRPCCAATSRPATSARPWSTWPSSRARPRCSARCTATCCAPPAPPSG